MLMNLIILEHKPWWVPDRSFVVTTDEHYTCTCNYIYTTCICSSKQHCSRIGCLELFSIMSLRVAPKMRTPH